MSFYDRDYYSGRGGGFGGGFGFFPPVLKNLLIINIAIFVLRSLASMGMPAFDEFILRYFSLVPLGVSDASFYPWQLVTYQFLHGSFGHVFFNMFALWMFGRELEYIWGSKKFLYYYLGCGVIGGLAQLLISDSYAITVGASGAVYGIMMAFALYFPKRPIYLYFLVPIPALYLILGMIVFDLLSTSGNSNIAHLAHLGGALSGAAYILLSQRYNFSFTRWFNNLKKRYDTKSNTNDFKPDNDSSTKRPFRKPMRNNSTVDEAQFYDINAQDEYQSSGKSDKKVTQEEIDRILDKISASGYQNLTEDEKKTLFEASKKN